MKHALRSGGNDDSGFLEFDEAGASPFLKFRQDCVDLVAGLNKLDLDGKMVGNL